MKIFSKKIENTANIYKSMWCSMSCVSLWIMCYTDGFCHMRLILLYFISASTLLKGTYILKLNINLLLRQTLNIFSLFQKITSSFGFNWHTLT